MRIFNQLKFEHQDIDYVSGHLKETVRLEAYVPGVNSGVYSKELHVVVVQKRPFKFFTWLKWKFGTEEKMVASITLQVPEMIQLRDEIDQILRLPFKKEKRDNDS